MREFKFRAFQDNKMYFQEKSGVYGTKDFFKRLYEDCELMQYIGLKDKNGKEGCHKDILKLIGTYIIERDEKTASYYLKAIEDEYNDIKNNWWEHIADGEIIGNIYSNPELLKGATNARD